MIETSTDWWQSPEAELLQPKAQIADYVESEGVPVPPRYQTMVEALGAVKDGSALALRSEHHNEYDGPSGLLQTHFIGLKEIQAGQREYSNYDGDSLDMDHEVHASAARAYYTGNSDTKPGYGSVGHMVVGQIFDVPPEVTISRLKALQSHYTPLERHLEITGQVEMPDFMDQVSYSFWKYVPGRNVTMVADDAIDNRYHLLVTSGRPLTWAGGVVVNEGGEILQGPIDKTGDRMPRMDTVQQLVHLYETVRNLKRFSSNHCPVIEMQIDDECNPWFLQYHRSRDFVPASETLQPDDYPDTEGWHKVDGVRGALQSPATLQTAFWYPRNYGSQRQIALRLPNAEEASTDWHYDFGLSEELSRRRTAYLEVHTLGEVYANIASGHESRTRWFKPQVAFAYADGGLVNLVPKEVRELVSKTVHRQGGMARVVLDFASDGKTGYVRLNPDSEQPVFTHN